MVVTTFFSCSTTEKFYVSGTPNTQIYTPNYKHIGTVEANGRAKIEIPSSDYYAFFLSKNPNSELYVPFALDYKKKGRIETHLWRNVGMGTMLLGTAIAIPCALLGEYTAAYVGLGMMVGGTLAGLPADSRLNQNSYKYQYQYLKSQQTNEDLLFTKTVFDEPFKEVSLPQIKKASKPTIVNEEASVSKIRLSDKSSKTLKDYGKQLEGVYIGSGILTQNREVIESYNGIKINIERINKNEVNVNVIEANGNEFFETPSQYKITKNKDGSYILNHSTISAATITVSKNGSLIYHHPKINIDGDIYVLKISTKNKL